LCLGEQAQAQLRAQTQTQTQPAVAKDNPADPAFARRLFDSWKTPVDPFRIVDGLYYVGASGVSSFLLPTPEGHVLLDSGFEDTVPLILTNIVRLGFDWRQIKLLLASHAHVDHTGGHARMQELTGATILMSAADAELLASGGKGDFSPFPGDLLSYRPANAGRLVADGERVTLGGRTLTALLTPGHTRGATTWATRLTHDGRSLEVVFFSSLTLVEGTRLRDNAVFPDIVAAYAGSITKLRALPCDVFLAPHGGAFGMADKVARLRRGEPPHPFIDPAALPAALDATERALRAQLGDAWPPGAVALRSP
jgi:metallo-beta-lactamase class B